MSDLISRKTVMNWMREQQAEIIINQDKSVFKDTSKDMLMAVNAMINFIVQLPTALEERQGDTWIPVTEGLPVLEDELDCKDVNATVKLIGGGRYVVPLMYRYQNGNPTWCHRNRVVPKQEVIAWMPLPTPYKEE